MISSNQKTIISVKHGKMDLDDYVKDCAIVVVFSKHSFVVFDLKEATKLS